MGSFLNSFLSDKNSEKIVTAIFIFFFLVLVLFYYVATKNYAIEEAEKRVKEYLLEHKAKHGYIEEIQKPVIYKLQREGKLYNEFFAPEILSFTFIARNIHEYHKKQLIKEGKEIYNYKLASDNPRNMINKANELESALLKKFNNKEITEYQDIIKKNGKEYLYKAIPIAPNKKSCMKCHSTPDVAPKEMVDRYGSVNGFNEKIGDIRAIISLSIPLDNQMQEAKKFFIALTAITFIVFIILYIFTIFIIKKQKELQRLEDEKEQANLAHQAKLAELGDMMSVIVHQWKQPLNIISLQTQDLSDAYEFNEMSPEYIDAYVKDTVKQVKFMSHTITNFRNFVKPDKTKEEISIEKTINDTIEILRPQLHKYSINIKVEGSNFKATAVAGEFQHVVLNLINNATDVLKDQTKENKSISITLNSEKREIIFEDNAGGISKDIINKIFDYHFSTKGDKGTGIGLYLVKKIIEESMNGKISVENSDVGARFIICL